MDTRGRPGGGPRVELIDVGPAVGGTSIDLDPACDQGGPYGTAAGGETGPGSVTSRASGAANVSGGLASLETPAVEGVGVHAVRCSPRLARRAASGVLEFAVARKARLQDCGARAAGGRRRLGRSRISELSRLCGVTLCEGEVDSFREYASYDL